MATIVYDKAKSHHEGDRFARSYFDFDRGAYLDDYETHLAAEGR